MIEDTRQFNCQHCGILVPKEREVVLGCVTFCSAKCVREKALKDIENLTKHHLRRVQDCLDTHRRFSDEVWLESIGVTW